ncbi:MAG: glycosyltransferase family 39 protein, partial [Anaerolineae bacterium]
YLVTASFLLLGASTKAIHVTSAVVGILSIPAVFLAAEVLAKDSEDPLKTWAGLVAALMMAISYWHLNWSRIGVRAVLVPLFGAGTIASLWHGLRKGRRWGFVVCGVSVGLSMYTYQAARLLPALIVISFAAFAWQRGTVTKRDWEHLLLVAAASLLVFAPLGLHFATHPESFSRRVEEAIVVEPDQGTAKNLRAVLRQIGETVLAFSFEGDRTPYSTIPGRPSLNPFLSALLFLGIGASVVEIKKPSRALLLAWLALLIIPAALAGKGPTAKRAIGTLPAVAMVIAVGALTPFTTFRHWIHRQRLLSATLLRWGWTVILLGGFIWSGVRTYRDYFVVWASNPNLPKHFEASVSSVGEYIGDLPPDEQVYLSPELPRHPAIRFHSNLRDDIRGFNGRVCFVAPKRPADDTTYVIIPGQGDTSLQHLGSIFPEGSRTHHLSGGEQASFISYRVVAGTQARVRPANPANATWAGDIQLIGYELDDDTYRAGETISLTLVYLDLRRMDKRHTAFVHLLGPTNPATGQPLWGQSDSEPCHGFYPTTSWHEGEILIDRVTVPIDGTAPSGTYTLSTGFYDVWTRQRLTLKSETAPSENNALFLAEVAMDGAH